MSFTIEQQEFIQDCIKEERKRIANIIRSVAENRARECFQAIEVMAALRKVADRIDPPGT